jgi:type VI secretion system protein ImpF
MVELTPKERLQPSLLDRLTDDEPDRKNESREKRVLSLKRLRECVMRDLAWLLNAGNLESVQDLEEYPLVAASVLNYGVRDLTGLTVSRTDPAVLERMLRDRIQAFEPRILRNTLKIRVRAEKEQMSRNALGFDIEGELWAQPTPMRLFLKTELDLDTGDVTIDDKVGREPR